MQKISSKDASALLKQAGQAILDITKENLELHHKLAARDREDRVVKIARDLEEKGLSSDLTFEEKVAAVRDAKDLNVTEEAVKMAAPQGNIIGDLSDAPGSGGGTALEHFILTGEDPR
jgi:hypothetical protein